MMSIRFLGHDIVRQFKNINAGVLELADEVDSKSIASDGVRVQVPPPAPYLWNKIDVHPLKPVATGFFGILGAKNSRSKPWMLF